MGPWVICAPNFVLPTVASLGRPSGEFIYKALFLRKIVCEMCQNGFLFALATASERINPSTKYLYSMGQRGSLVHLVIISRRGVILPVLVMYIYIYLYEYIFVFV